MAECQNINIYLPEQLRHRLGSSVKGTELQTTAIEILRFLVRRTVLLIKADLQLFLTIA